MSFYFRVTGHTHKNMNFWEEIMTSMSYDQLHATSYKYIVSNTRGDHHLKKKTWLTKPNHGS